MKRELLITTDLKVKEYCPLNLKQFDTTKLIFNILNDSLLVDLANLTAELVFTKPNKTVVIQNCTIEENQIVANLLADCLRIAGNATIEVSLKENNEIFSSFIIPVKIESSGKEKVESSNTPNYIEALEEAILKEQERQKNENERIIAEKERKNNENERIQAENDRQNNENLRVIAEEERQLEENLRKNSETERLSAEETRNIAEQERQKNEEERINVFNNMTGEIKPTRKYYVLVETSITEIQIPAQYIVGADILDVYYNGERLIKASTSDTEGHYYEVGDADTLSNQIRLTSDWQAEEGDVFEFVIKGVYTNEATT